MFHHNHGQLLYLAMLTPVDKERDHTNHASGNKVSIFL